MKPDDLVEYSRASYDQSVAAGGWAGADVIDQGLYDHEQALIAMLPEKRGRLLVVGMGGGREAIPLGRMGFDVTGVDYIPQLVEHAVRNAAEREVRIKGIVQEASQLDMPLNAFEVAWLPTRMYSLVPTAQRRIEMLRRIKRSLVAGGHCLCEFVWNPRAGRSTGAEAMRRAVAWLTMGNRSYETGDRLSGGLEFVHYFFSRDQLLFEFLEGGFEPVHLLLPDDSVVGQAVLKAVTR
jgi:hypothetical protein